MKNHFDARRFCGIFAIILLAASSRGPTQENEFIPLIEFRDFVKKLSENQAGLHLSFAEITYDVGDTRLGGPFGPLIRDKLMRLAGSVSNVTTAPLGAAQNLRSGARHYRVEGNYWEAGEVMQLRLIFTPLNGENKEARKSLGLWAERPQSIEVISAAAVRQTFAHWSKVYSFDPSFKVDITASVETGGRIVIGQPFTIAVKANRDCYFVLMNRDAGGHVEAIWPRGDEENRLAAGKPQVFDNIQLQEPYGLEVLFVFASRQPIRPQEAQSFFAEYYAKYISKLFADRAIKRKDVAVNWTFIYSIPPK